MGSKLSSAIDDYQNFHIGAKVGKPILKLPIKQSDIKAFTFSAVPKQNLRNNSIFCHQPGFFDLLNG